MSRDSDLREIYEGKPFHKRNKNGVAVAYDGGGDFVSYASASPGAQYLSTDGSGGVTYSTPAVSASEIAQLTAGATNAALPSASGTEESTNLLSDSQLGNAPSNSSSSNSSASGGALAGILKALGLGGGNTSNTAALSALTGLLGAAGQYSQNKALTPTFNPPALFGGTAGSTSGNAAGSASTGFGPAGGYNYANYKGLTAGSPGLGYAPRTQVNPNIPNYYTYGQKPQSSFFSSGTPPVGTAPTAMSNSQVAPTSGPTAMARGGHVKRFDAGGMIGPSTPIAGPGAPPAPAGMSAPQAPAMHMMGPTPMPGTPAGLPPRPMMTGTPPPPQMPQARPAMPPVAQNRPMIGAAGRQGGMQPGVPRMGGTPPMMSRPTPINTGTSPMLMRATGGSTPPMASSNVITQPGSNSPLGALMQTWRHAGANSTRPYADGGSDVSRHVKGPGDGTSDSIPARLANGEYVMDAQTVSMLGNGDNGAGAKQLDSFRQSIRKHKGAALAKGQMAPDAKEPHQYLKGGQ